MADTLPWLATIATVVAASMTAANLGARVTGFGFLVFTFGALCWTIVGAATGQPALMWTNIILLLLDLFGVWRWLGRQKGVEEGARAASMASEATPGEALFPISLLSRSPVVSPDGIELGRCVDAMAGSVSGALSYVVVSEGGVAGVGETLRRLPWADSQVANGQVVARMEPDQFNRLREVERGQWPAR